MNKQILSYNFRVKRVSLVNRDVCVHMWTCVDEIIKTTKGPIAVAIA